MEEILNLIWIYSKQFFPNCFETVAKIGKDGKSSTCIIHACPELRFAVLKIHLLTLKYLNADEILIQNQKEDEAGHNREVLQIY